MDKLSRVQAGHKAGHKAVCTCTPLLCLVTTYKAPPIDEIHGHYLYDKPNEWCCVDYRMRQSELIEGGLDVADLAKGCNMMEVRETPRVAPDTVVADITAFRISEMFMGSLEHNVDRSELNFARCFRDTIDRPNFDEFSTGLSYILMHVMGGDLAFRLRAGSGITVKRYHGFGVIKSPHHLILEDVDTPEWNEDMGTLYSNIIVIPPPGYLIVGHFYKDVMDYLAFTLTKDTSTDAERS